MNEFDGRIVEVDPEEVKMCSKCKEYKVLTADNFPRNKSSKDGFSHWCKVCHSNNRKKKVVDTAIDAVWSKM